jgi:hypothetical protein
MPSVANGHLHRGFMKSLGHLKVVSMSACRQWRICFLDNQYAADVWHLRKRANRNLFMMLCFAGEWVCELGIHRWLSETTRVGRC